VKYTSEGTPRRKGRCRNCGIYCHWKEDCKRPQRKERKEEANVAQADHENPSLLLATVDAAQIDRFPVDVKQQEVHLHEKKVYPEDCDEVRNVWVLDTGASNHMTGRREVL